LSIWVASPTLLFISPTLFGAFTVPSSWSDLWNDVAVLWLVIGAGAIVFRVAQLSLKQDLQTGLVWATKILTDPFHDVMLYYKAPLYVLKGEFLDVATSDQAA